MEFIQQHKKTIIVGFVAFCIGYVLGEVRQARSFEQEMAGNIFNHVTSSQEKLRSKFN